jgi:hypothetical protein
MRWAVVALLLCSMSFQAARGEIDAEQVRQAIDAGVNKLLDAQADDGTWTEVHTNMPGGVTALCTLALLTSGVSIDDPKIQRALTLLRKLHPHMTYTNSLQTLVMCAAEPKKDLLHIQENVRWLESQQLRDGPKRGAWGYGNKQGSGDNSNTQFALLALHEARRVGIQVNDQTWKLAQAYWLRTQNFDGSWGYMEGQPGTGSMTCAGITALLITMDELMRGDAEIVNGQIRCCGAQQDNDALERALDWMGRHFQASSNPGMGQNWLLYYLYGVERVGRLTNRRYLGAHDWYREGAEKLVAMQDHNIGWWRGGGHAEENREIATSLALLFLAKGRRPVLISKLQHQRGDDWNHHRADLGNLTAYVEKQWNRELTWQTIDLARATSDDLLQSPVLWMSGHESLQLNDNQVKALRDYIDRGGFLFAEQCCGNGDYDRSFRALMRQIYPEPEHELKLLPPEHPIWTAEERVDATYLKPLWGIDVGCRTAVVYCPEDLGCLWDIAHPGRDNWVAQRVRPQIEAARSIGINVLAYATNRELKYKLDMIAPPLAADQKEDST